MELSRNLLIQANEAHSLYLQLCYDFWIQHSLYSWKWWLLILILIVPWYFWWRIVDKKKFLEISCYGILTFVVVMALDATGISHGYWYYPVRLAPKFPHILPVDTTILPIVYMLLFQYFTIWKKYIVAAVFMSAGLAFIGEPFAAQLGYYELLTWKYYYSLPIYFLLAVFLKYVVEAIKTVQEKEGRKVPTFRRKE